MNSRILQPKTTPERPLKCEPPEAGSEVDQIDNRLVRRTRQGDLGAFEQLFERHQKRVYSIAVHMLSDETDAADATQEAFVRVYQSIGRLKSDAAFVTWLKTTIINVCRDMLRKRKRSRTESLDACHEGEDGSTIAFEMPDWTHEPARNLDRQFMRSAVRNAISSLSPGYREVVGLFYVDGMDVAGIAQVLGCPVGTVKSKLARARAELKRKLECYVE